MNNFPIWKSRPVFITSTFLDMQAERDYLHHFVFPELEERLRTRFHYLEPIDLRWGVDTVSEASEEARHLLVLKVCLGEIERSRPFLIALLGDRYGWVPPLERIQAAAQEVGYRRELVGKSVTALEIEYGVLDNPEQCRRSRFYLREPLPYEQMDARTAALYSERYTGKADAATAETQLQALKVRIKREQPDRWRSYQVEWDPQRCCVTGLEAWGQQVLEDLWSDLAAETHDAIAEATGTWQQQEALVLEQFIATECRDFIGRKDILDQLQQLALSPAADNAPWGACVTGTAGAGKSALFAQLYRMLAKHDLIVLIHAAGISTQSIQLNALLRRWIGELAAALNITDPSEELTEHEDLPKELTEREKPEQTLFEKLEQTFAELLERTATQRRVVCLIDALDQFEPSSEAQHLTWLPKPWPANARLMVTANGSELPKALTQSSDDNINILELPLLHRSVSLR